MNEAMRGKDPVFIFPSCQELGCNYPSTFCRLLTSLWPAEITERSIFKKEKFPWHSWFPWTSVWISIHLHQIIKLHLFISPAGSWDSFLHTEGRMGCLSGTFQSIVGRWWSYNNQREIWHTTDERLLKRVKALKVINDGKKEDRRGICYWWSIWKSAILIQTCRYVSLWRKLEMATKRVSI